MDQRRFNKMIRGNIIRNEGTGQSYVIESTYRDSNGKIFYVAVTSVMVTNPSEWRLIR